MSEQTCLGGESDCPCSTEADGTCEVFVQPATFAAVAEALAEMGERDGRGNLCDLAARLRAALANQSAQDGLSRAGTTSVASGATGDVTGAQIGAQDEGGKA